MPEGDTVWNTAQMLNRALAGTTVRHSDFRVPQLATVDLAGWTVAESTSRGKHLLLRLTSPKGDRAQTLRTHLRMDGVWRVYAPGEVWRGRPSHLIRVVLRTGTRVAVGYHLHDIVLIPTAEEENLLGHLGPDLLGDDWDADEAVRRLWSAPDRPIGEALLDQRNLAGIGNVYKCEVLFLRGLNPWTPVDRIADVPGVVSLAHRLLTANRGRWNHVTTGSLRKGEANYVYGRGGAPCRRCGGPIARDDGDDRVTYWCPRCQPAEGADQPVPVKDPKRKSGSRLPGTTDVGDDL